MIIEEYKKRRSVLDHATQKIFLISLIISARSVLRRPECLFERIENIYEIKHILQILRAIDIIDSTYPCKHLFLVTKYCYIAVVCLEMGIWHTKMVQNKQKADKMSSQLVIN